MNTETYTNLATLESDRIGEVVGNLPSTIVGLRRHFANPSRPNPVTKVAERLADLETVDLMVSEKCFTPAVGIQTVGEQFLAEIHRELETTSTDIVLSNLRDDNAVAHIHLGILNHAEELENEERAEET